MGSISACPARKPAALPDGASSAQDGRLATSCAATHNGTSRALGNRSEQQLTSCGAVQRVATRPVSWSQPPPGWRCLPAKRGVGPLETELECLAGDSRLVRRALKRPGSPPGVGGGWAVFLGCVCLRPARRGVRPADQAVLTVDERRGAPVLVVTLCGRRRPIARTNPWIPSGSRRWLQSACGIHQAEGTKPRASAGCCDHGVAAGGSRHETDGGPVVPSDRSGRARLPSKVPRARRSWLGSVAGRPDCSRNVRSRIPFGWCLRTAVVSSGEAGQRRTRMD